MDAKRYLIIDDTVCSGNTLSTIRVKVATFAPDAVCVGALLYDSGDRTRPAAYPYGIDLYGVDDPLPVPAVLRAANERDEEARYAALRANEIEHPVTTYAISPLIIPYLAPTPFKSLLANPRPQVRATSPPVGIIQTRSRVGSFEEPVMSWITTTDGTKIGTGTRARFHSITARDPTAASIAGMQMKITATHIDITGTVRHVRGDHPIKPTTVAFFVQPDGEIDRSQQTVYCDRCETYETVIPHTPGLKCDILPDSPEPPEEVGAGDRVLNRLVR